MQSDTLPMANNHFGWNLLQQLAHDETKNNIWTSPVSMASILASIACGASGGSKSEMWKSMHYDSVGSEDDIKNAFNSLLVDLMNIDPEVVLQLNEAAFYRSDGDVHSQWVQMVQQVFHGTATQITSLDAINKWCTDHSGRRIDSIMKSLDDHLALLLLGSLYIQGKWTYGFNPNDTQDMTFHGTTGDKTVKMMTQTRNDFRYHEDDVIQAIELPMGKADRLCAMMVLPRTKTTPLNDWLAKITPEYWQNLITSFHEHQGTLHMPRIVMTYTPTSLASQMRDLGIKAAFKGGLDRIGNLHLTDVWLKAMIELKEDGIEAAAIDGTPMFRAASTEDAFAMTIDRPFMMCIMDRQSGSILFMGRIDNPQ